MTKAWYWHSYPLKRCTGSEIFAALFLSTDSSFATLLESPYPSDHNLLARYSICAGAPRVIQGQLQMWTPPVGKILPFLQELLIKETRGEVSPFLSSNSVRELGFPHDVISDDFVTPFHLPFTGGCLGWLGYDLAWEIEQLPRYKDDSLPFPVAYWYIPESFAILDHVEQTLWLAATEVSGLDEMKTKLEVRESIKENNYSSLSKFSTLSSQEEYETAVQRAKKHIQAGDIFQANLSLRFTTQTNASGWNIYQALQKINPSPFACYYKTPWGEVVSCSPERLVQTQKINNLVQVSTRPIAGTRRRGTTPEQDEMLAHELINNIKELAEHIMLVDLERNDLGKVCEWGTVKVDELLTIERYSHVMHLVSNVTGLLKPNLNFVDLIGAVFPGGTITGCPKIRCMEIIEELEPVRRSLFYGSCGYLDWRGNLDLNILIRTLLVTSSGQEECNSVWGQVGAGIVADSNPEDEWYESLQKAQAQIMALQNVCYPTI
ncbi:MAG: anthranilate synthase component I [Calothrix sp. C42_A2020_038]|nr:anthranilate synthase component I [Calothrix sp. C42_A2020_038]